MPLIKEIENALAFVAELPEGVQASIAKMMSRLVVAHDDRKTMTLEEWQRLRTMDNEAFWSRLTGCSRAWPTRRIARAGAPHMLRQLRHRVLEKQKPRRGARLVWGLPNCQKLVTRDS